MTCEIQRLFANFRAWEMRKEIKRRSSCKVAIDQDDREAQCNHLAYVASRFCSSRRLKFEFVEIPARKNREDEAVDLVPFGTL
jgi:hypothetical protein